MSANEGVHMVDDFDIIRTLPLTFPAVTESSLIDLGSAGGRPSPDDSLVASPRSARRQSQGSAKIFGKASRVRATRKLRALQDRRGKAEAEQRAKLPPPSPVPAGVGALGLLAERGAISSAQLAAGMASGGVLRQKALQLEAPAAAAARGARSAQRILTAYTDLLHVKLDTAAASRYAQDGKKPAPLRHRSSPPRTPPPPSRPLSLLSRPQTPASPRAQSQRRRQQQRSGDDDDPSSPRGPPPLVASTAAGLSDMEKIRGYLELLDEFSLHHFVIYRGAVVDSTPEFASFKRTYAERWGGIDVCIAQLKALMVANAVPVAVVDGKKVAELAGLSKERVHADDLLACLANVQQVLPLVRVRRVVTPGEGLREAAATVVQSGARMLAARRRCAAIRRAHAAATRIQSLGRGLLGRRAGERALERKRCEWDERWQELQQALRDGWHGGQLQGGPRVLVHVPSASSAEELYRVTDAHFDTRQNMQMGRLCALMDPAARVVYVSPCTVPDDVLDYHVRLLELAGAEHVRQRLTVVVPERYDTFPAHFPLASVLLYSPGCMRRLRLLVKGRPALLIAGAPGWQDRRLALALGVPLLGPPSGGVGALCATRSGVRSVFDAADVSTPPGAHELYHEDEVATALAALISAHIDVGRWVIRLECTWQGRGIAYVDTSRVQCVGQLRQERRAVLKAAGGGGAAWHEPLIQLAARERIAQELRACLPKYATICDGASYRSWAHFARHVARLGCVIEAEADAPLGRPQATLFLPPGGGEPLLLCASEQLLSEGYRPLGWAAPQRAVPARALEGAARAVCGALQAQGAVGYATVTFAAFWDAAKGAKRLWGVGLELGLSDAAATHMQCSAMLGGPARHLGVYRQAASGGSAAQMPESTGSSNNTASRGEGQLSTAAAPCHVYMSYLYHPQLADVHLGALFKYSRLEGVSFDMQSRHGILFELLGGLSCGAVAMLASAPSHRDALTRALRGLKFLRQVAGAPPPAAAARGEPAWFLEAAATLALQLQRMKSGSGGGGGSGDGGGSGGASSGGGRPQQLAQMS